MPQVTTHFRVLATLIEVFLKRKNVGKGENAGNQHFLLSPQFLYHFKQRNRHLRNINLWSANTFNLVEAKILMFGKELLSCSPTRFSQAF